LEKENKKEKKRKKRGKQPLGLAEAHSPSLAPFPLPGLLASPPSLGPASGSAQQKARARSPLPSLSPRLANTLGLRVSLLSPTFPSSSAHAAEPDSTPVTANPVFDGI